MTTLSYQPRIYDRVRLRLDQDWSAAFNRNIRQQRLSGRTATVTIEHWEPGLAAVLVDPLGTIPLGSLLWVHASELEPLGLRRCV